MLPDNKVAVWLVDKFLLIDRLEMWIISMKLQTLQQHSGGMAMNFFVIKIEKSGLFQVCFIL